MKKVSLFLMVFSFAFAACPEGYYEDSCGDCWRDYCYDYVTHDVFYDLDQEECDGATQMWVIPSADSNDPYFNNYCGDTCPDGFMADECGSCWSSFCYTLFSPGLNGDGPHSVYYDLSDDECIANGFGYYTPDNPSNPSWNSNCSIDCNGDVNGTAMMDDCGECLSGYCYDYVIRIIIIVTRIMLIIVIIVWFVII